MGEAGDGHALLLFLHLLLFIAVFFLSTCPMAGGKAGARVRHGCQHQKKTLKLLLNIFFNPFSRLRGPDWALVGFFGTGIIGGKREKRSIFVCV